MLLKAVSPCVKLVQGIHIRPLGLVRRWVVEKLLANTFQQKEGYQLEFQTVTLLHLFDTTLCCSTLHDELQRPG